MCVNSFQYLPLFLATANLSAEKIYEEACDAMRYARKEIDRDERCNGVIIVGSFYTFSGAFLTDATPLFVRVSRSSTKRSRYDREGVMRRAWTNNKNLCVGRGAKRW